MAFNSASFASALDSSKDRWLVLDAARARAVQSHLYAKACATADTSGEMTLFCELFSRHARVFSLILEDAGIAPVANSDCRNTSIPDRESLLDQAQQLIQAYEAILNEGHPLEICHSTRTFLKELRNRITCLEGYHTPPAT